MTIDAIGCQTKIAKAILVKEADYLLAVKSNWPGLHAEIARYFADAPARPSTGWRPSMAIMAASRSAATP